MGYTGASERSGALSALYGSIFTADMDGYLLELQRESCIIQVVIGAGVFGGEKV